MVCDGLETLVDNSITGILAFPTSCDYQFYAKVLVAFFIIIATTLYLKEKEKFLKADMISSLGVSAIATIFVALIGTMLNIVQPDIFLEILVGGIVFIVLWLIKR